MEKIKEIKETRIAGTKLLVSFHNRQTKSFQLYPLLSNWSNRLLAYFYLLAHDKTKTIERWNRILPGPILDGILQPYLRLIDSISPFEKESEFNALLSKGILEIRLGRQGVCVFSLKFNEEYYYINDQNLPFDLWQILNKKIF